VGGARWFYGGGIHRSSGAQGGGGGLSSHKKPSHRGLALVNDLQGGPNMNGGDLQVGVVSVFEVMGVNSDAGSVVGLVVLTLYLAPPFSFSSLLTPLLLLSNHPFLPPKAHGWAG
jgi:hypothetical protein